MSQDRVGKPWTKEEDELLIQAVAVHGEVDNWKTVALSISGRTNKACRKRWLHSLSPSVKKTAWTPEEDKLLLSLYALHGTKWSVIARGISGRTDDACSKRYREALDPTLKKDEWTSEEDDRLLQVYARLGGKWGQVGHELNRSGLACRNRWRLLQRRKAANNSQSGQQTLNSTVGPSTQHPAPLDHVNPSAWIPSLPGIDPSQLWSGGRSAGYYEPLDYHTQEHNYASTSFGPSLGPVSIPNGMHSGSSSPPPFQFSSSSLSAALSISRPTNNVPSSSHHTSEPQNPSTSPGSHRPSSIDGEPIQPTPSYSPEPQQHDLEFEAHPPGGGDNDHYEITICQFLMISNNNHTIWSRHALSHQLLQNLVRVDLGWKKTMRVSRRHRTSIRLPCRARNKARFLFHIELDICPATAKPGFLFYVR
ncbi:hypothetical protein QCA50_001470 [Cerrena zonata]|uniref:Uncharacterized protein n=1 Tax=Cerrena zonata TaxID=2478898 RepID=A0AAW0GL26_9APHY